MVWVRVTIHTEEKIAILLVFNFVGDTSSFLFLFTFFSPIISDQ